MSIVPASFDLDLARYGELDANSRNESAAFRFTWSLNGRPAKEGRFLAHLTAMNKSLALVS